MTTTIRHLAHRRSPFRWTYAWSIMASVVVSSCGVIFETTRPTHMEVRSQTLANGHLIALSAGRPVGPVNAFITRGNWLVVSIADSLLEVDDLRHSIPAFADSVDVTRFPTTLQLAFHLTVQISNVEVVQEPGSPDIWISLFAPSREPRRR